MSPGIWVAFSRCYYFPFESDYISKTMPGGLRTTADSSGSDLSFRIWSAKLAFLAWILDLGIHVRSIKDIHPMIPRLSNKKTSKLQDFSYIPQNKKRLA